MGRFKTQEERQKKRMDKALDHGLKIEKQINGFRSKWMEKHIKETEAKNKFKNQAIHNTFQQLSVPQKKG